MKNVYSLIILFLCGYIIINLKWDPDNIHPMEVVTPLIAIIVTIYFVVDSLLKDID